MDTIVHLNISAFPVILLAVIFVSMRRNTIQTTDNRLFSNLVLYTCVVLLAELATWAINGISPYLTWTANMLYFMSLPILLLMWISYVYFHIKRQTIRSMAKGKKLLVFLLLLVYYLILLSTPWTAWFFDVNADNMYVRGHLFYVPHAICLCLMILAASIALEAAIKDKGKFRKAQCYCIAGLTAFPIAATLLQSFVSNLWITLPGTAIAELLIYIYLQWLSIKHDALTGINNRGCFDKYLYTQLAQTDRKQPLCLFMLDMDNFKLMNDTYGHGAGDAALIQAAAVLSDLLHGTDAFLARYGGDEFSIIMHCENTHEADKVVAHIKSVFEIDNYKKKRKYELSCSVGYCLAEPGTKMTPEEMILQADSMLYKNKAEEGEK